MIGLYIVLNITAMLNGSVVHCARHNSHVHRPEAVRLAAKVHAQPEQQGLVYPIVDFENGRGLSDYDLASSLKMRVYRSSGKPGNQPLASVLART